MLNAKTELLEAVRESKILCAELIITDEHYHQKVIKLFVGESVEAFLELLDFDYDESYGSRYITGMVLLDDNAWLTRGTYDGAEWWEYHQYPKYILNTLTK
jgi:hypothetical protein